MKLRLIISQIVLGFSLMIDPANPQHGFGLAIMSFGVTGLFNNTVEFFKKLKEIVKESNDHV